jgi:protein translocase SecG subunit
MEFLVGLQIVVCAALIVSILLQRGTSGLGTVFGGGVTESFRTKRGFEAFIYNVTIFLGVLFIANSLAIAITTG